jgi:AraC-like DNA-binding protein
MLGGSMVVLIYSMGYLGLRQPLIFSRLGTTDDTTENEVASVLQLPAERSAVDEQKYKNSPISSELGENLLQELQNHMSDHKPFLDSEISLPRLAEQLDMSLNYLSQVINQQAGKNFFDFINSYRIAEATTLLAEDAENQQNILNLAMSVGFNSKSAFYNAFKKHTGMTPTQYRAQLKIKETAV